VSDDQAAGRLQRAKAGDGRAFEELLAPVLDPAFRLAMTMLKDRGAAEDAVQEAALKAWRKLGGFRAGSQVRAVVSRDRRQRMPLDAPNAMVERDATRRASTPRCFG
jgi:RNA polymerase sigma-70 factor (ECF subfamily)